MKTSCLRLKLVELNFLVSFNTDDQRKTDVTDTVKRYHISILLFRKKYCFIGVFVYLFHFFSVTILKIFYYIGSHIVKTIKYSDSVIAQ